MLMHVTTSCTKPPVQTSYLHFYRAALLDNLHKNQTSHNNKLHWLHPRRFPIKHIRSRTHLPLPPGERPPLPLPGDLPPKPLPLIILSMCNESVLPASHYLSLLLFFYRLYWFNAVDWLWYWWQLTAWWRWWIFLILGVEWLMVDGRRTPKIFGIPFVARCHIVCPMSVKCQYRIWQLSKT